MGTASQYETSRGRFKNCSRPLALSHGNYCRYVPGKGASDRNSMSRERYYGGPYIGPMVYIKNYIFDHLY